MEEYIPMDYVIEFEGDAFTVTFFIGDNGQGIELKSRSPVLSTALNEMAEQLQLHDL